MGLRDRLRIARILGGEERPMKDVHQMGVSEKVVSVVESGTRVLVEKTLAPKWAKKGLVGQVAVCRKMMRLTGVAKFREKFMPGFQEDLRDKQKAGASDDEIVGYYMGCSEFAEFWKRLGNDEGTLRVLLGERGA